MRCVTEPERNLPVIDEKDVAVVGAGPAGIGAAIGAARAGARTLLLERYGCVGGNMTVGGVLNIRQYTDDEKQIIGSVAAELADRIREKGGTRETPAEGRYVRHDPEITRYVAQEMLLEEGVKLFLHTDFAEAVVENNSVQGVITESKSGRSSILANTTVDATGDGDVLWRAGASFEKADRKTLQPMTLTFVMGGVTCWPEPGSQELREAAQAEIETGTFPIAKPPSLFPLRREGWVYANATRIPGDSTDTDDLTNGEIEGRRQMMALVEWLRQNAPGYENAFVVRSGARIGPRESRRLKGLYTLTREDVLGYRQFEDTIALAAYGIDIHYPGQGGEMTWLEPGRCYGIPYRCLVPERVDGLVASGRCISADRAALGSVRVMAICMATGQAAGVAAALAAESGLPLRDLDAADIRQTLIGQGALL